MWQVKYGDSNKDYITGGKEKCNIRMYTYNRLYVPIQSPDFLKSQEVRGRNIQIADCTVYYHKLLQGDDEGGGGWGFFSVSC